MFNVQMVISGRNTVTPTELNRRLGRLSKSFRDLTPLWKEISPILYRIMTKKFASEGAFAGSKWKELKASYAELKQKLWGDRPILVASGKLYSSLTAKASRDNILTIKPSYMEFGTKVPYAGVHQTGSRRKGIPRRDILPTIAVLRTKGKLDNELADITFDRVRKVLFLR